MNTMSEKKRLFIINLLLQEKALTRRQICCALQRTFHSEAMLPRSSWNRYLEQIRRETPFIIYFDAEEKVYKIRRNKMKGNSNDTLLDCLISSYNVVDSASMMMKHADIIHNADNIAGTSAIGIILQAIDEQRGLSFTYTSFVNNTRKRRNYIPYFLSTWEGRWYLVAEAETHPGDLYTYALDRMSEIKVSFERVKHTIQTTAKEFFQYSYGIQHAEKEQAIDIVLRVSGPDVKYVRSKKIHPSQEEIETGKDYALFRLHLAPCYNFYQQLLWHRENITVISPKDVSDEICRIIAEIAENYR